MINRHGWKITEVKGKEIMARGGRGSKPTHYIAVTAKVGNGKYEKGPYIGLWEGDDDRGPLFRGSVQGKYLDELADFIKDFGEDNISFAVFESRGDKGGRNSRNNREDDQDAAPRGRRTSSRDSRRGDEDRGERSSSREKSSRRDEKEDSRSSRRDEKDDDRGSKRGGKKNDSWWED